MNAITVTRPPTSTVPPAVDRGDGRRPLLTLRLSDGRTWAHKFGASTADELRDGAFEAWVACRLEWQRRADEMPAHQTIKRTTMLSTVPAALELQVLDTSVVGGAWISANYGTDAMKQVIVRCHGTATNAEDWDGAPWLDTWGRCLRAWWGAAELSRFLSNLARDLDLEGRVEAELRRIGGDGATTL